jgi:hypothetical protein
MQQKDMDSNATSTEYQHGSTWSFATLSTNLPNSEGGPQTQLNSHEESESMSEEPHHTAMAQADHSAVVPPVEPECADRDDSRSEHTINTKVNSNPVDTTEHHPNASSTLSADSATHSLPSNPLPQPTTTAMTVESMRGPNHWIHELLDHSTHTSPPVMKAPATWSNWVKANGPQPAGGRTVTASEVRGLLPVAEVATYSSENVRNRVKDSMERDCGICFNGIVEGAMGKCGHVYCSACLIEEALRERKCPYCKQVLIPVELKIVEGGEVEQA